MKSIRLALCALLPSCALTPEQLQTVQIDAFKTTQAAGVGYLQGGKAGAINSATAQILANQGLTAAKQPVKVLP